jgi:hypothetical protein
MGYLYWRESGVEGQKEFKKKDLIPLQAPWSTRLAESKKISSLTSSLSRPIFKEGTLEGRLDTHVQFQSPMETCSWSGSQIGWGSMINLIISWAVLKSILPHHFITWAWHYSSKVLLPSSNSVFTLQQIQTSSTPESPYTAYTVEYNSFKRSY